MSLEISLEQYPKEMELKGGLKCAFRPLTTDDELAFHEFFLAVPLKERLFIKHRVTEPEVIHGWCQNIDLEHKLPLLAVYEGQIIGDATLHQNLGGWKRHIGRTSVLIHPQYRGRGLARALLTDLIELARHLGLEKVEAEFIDEQEHAMKVFGLLGFTKLVHLPEYVKDMEGGVHDYIQMGLVLKTDEEYAGMG